MTNLVKKHIISLLRDYDTVVIPDFGGFITYYRSAEMNPVKNTFEPPYKKIAFNNKLKLNDGLLINSISKSEDITQEKAVALVNEFVSEIINEIKNNKKWIFDGVGTFFINTENKLQFESVSDVNYLNSSFALPNLTFKPIYREREINKPKPRPTSIASDVTRPASTPSQKKEDPIAVILGKKEKKHDIAASADHVSGDKPLSPFDKVIKAGPSAHKSEIIQEKFIGKKNIIRSQLQSHKKVLDAIGSDSTAKEPKKSNIVTLLMSVVVILIISSVILFFINNKNKYSIDFNVLNPGPYISSLFFRGDEIIGTDVSSIEEKGESEIMGIEEKEEKDIKELEEIGKKEMEGKGDKEIKKIKEIGKKEIKEQSISASKAGSIITKKTGRFYIIIGGFSMKNNALKLKDKLLREKMDTKVIAPDIHNKLHRVTVADYKDLDEALRNLNKLRAKYGNSIWVLNY